MKSYQKKLIKIRVRKVFFEVLYAVVAFAAPLLFTYLYVPTITLDPSALTSITFNSQAILKSDVSRWSFSLALIITVFFTVLNGVKYIKDRLVAMPFSATKQVFYAIKGALIPALLITIYIFLNSFLYGFINGLGVTLIVNAVFIFTANSIIKLFINYYDYEEAKRMRKNEMIEALEEKESESEGK